MLTLAGYGILRGQAATGHDLTLFNLDGTGTVVGRLPARCRGSANEARDQKDARLKESIHRGNI
jgi:hypothetical protein